MKKLFVFALLTSSTAFSFDMEAAKAVGAKAADAGKKVFADCKSEQVKFCPKMTELAPLKACLAENKAKLSDTCKKALGL